jgi:release factor glutamine methyltransferase
MSESELLKFNFAIKDLKNNKPIQYILGKTEFYGLPFRVNPHVLIPRPETEELVDLIIRENKGNTLRILDIGTGSGCIPITLKKHLTAAEIHALDVSAEAIQVARENAELNEASLQFWHYDIRNEGKGWKEGLFDLIVSNPPYVLLAEKTGMEARVLNHEPALALFVEEGDPLFFYRRIMAFASLFLNAGGKLYLEINRALGKEMTGLLKKSGYTDIQLYKDLNGNDRILRASK